MSPSSKLMSPLWAGLFMLALAALMQLASAGLASFVINNRPRLFQRIPQANQQTQPQQLQPQASQHHQQQIMFAANNMMPNYGHFGQQADLLRVDHRVQQQQQQQQVMLEPAADQQSQFAHHLDTQAAGYYKPSVEPLVNFIPAQNIAAAAANARGIRLEPSQTEIVDKIERHIGQQIEQSLSSEPLEQHNAEASGYQQHHEEGAKEKAESSGSHPEESEEVEEPVAEKRHEEKKSAEEHHHHHHHEEHHHPLEAFEVHHKKGGKSFQYFHQGHHHSS